MSFTTYPERLQSSDKVAHLSFDDMENLVIDIRKNEKSYSSIFNNAVLSELRDYHQKYDAKFTLYTYDSIADFELIDFSSH